MASQGNWLLLARYALKHRLSVSTVRRYIKKNKVTYRFLDHKYYIKDEAVEGAQGMTPQETRSEEGVKQLLEFCKQLIHEKEKMYQDLLKDKIREIASLKERLSEQRMLINIMEEKLHQGQRPSGAI